MLLSVRKPGKIAGKVSPVEAVKYVDTSNEILKKSKSSKNVNEFTMAKANFNRNKKKTIISALSIALALVLFQGSINVVRGFDEEKYLESWTVSDFIVGKANFFNNALIVGDRERSISKEEIKDIEDNIYIQNSGKVYVAYDGKVALSKEDFILYNGEDFKEIVDKLPQNSNGEVFDRTLIFGYNDFLLDKLEVFEGSIEDLKNIENGIIAIYRSDDYGVPRLNSNVKDIGDTVQLMQNKKIKYINVNTNEEVTDPNEINSEYVMIVPDDIYFKDYKVVAKATIKHPMSARYSGPLQFAVREDSLDIGSEGVGILAFLFDVEDGKVEEAESFLKEYTHEINPALDYESKALKIEDFSGLKNTFTLVGLSFSIVLALIGVLNFFNSITTSIISRSREFAVLNAIGMTDKQLKSTLILEVIFYICISGGIALLITFILNTFGWNNLENLLWFFSAKSSYVELFILLMAFIIIGIGISTLGYKILNKNSIIDRLRGI